MGHKNLNKVLVPRVISMAEEFIIAPRRSHARIVRPRQWHVTRRGHIVERESFREGVGPDMTERMVATTTFNASYQISWLHLCGKDP